MRWFENVEGELSEVEPRFAHGVLTPFKGGGKAMFGGPKHLAAQTPMPWRLDPSQHR